MSSILLLLLLTVKSRDTTLVVVDNAVVVLEIVPAQSSVLLPLDVVGSSNVITDFDADGAVSRAEVGNEDASIAAVLANDSLVAMYTASIGKVSDLCSIVGSIAGVILQPVTATSHEFVVGSSRLDGENS